MKRNSDGVGIMQNAENTRYPAVDLIRIIAAIMVTMTHSIEYAYQIHWDKALLASKTLCEKLFTVTMFSVGRLGVPLFLIISGFLLLDREYDSKKMKYFWKNNWLRLFLVTEIWIVLYSLFSAVALKSQFSIKNLATRMLFLRTFDDSQYSNIWYMYMIIGLYPLIPFVANSLHNLGEAVRKLAVGSVNSSKERSLNVLLKVPKTTVKWRFSDGLRGGTER